MDVNEALKYADRLKADYYFIEEYRIASIADVAIALAAEVRRLRENMAQLMTVLECKDIVIEMGDE